MALAAKSKNSFITIRQRNNQEQELMEMYFYMGILIQRNLPSEIIPVQIPPTPSTYLSKKVLQYNCILTIQRTQIILVNYQYILEAVFNPVVHTASPAKTSIRTTMLNPRGIFGNNFGSTNITKRKRAHIHKFQYILMDLLKKLPRFEANQPSPTFYNHDIKRKSQDNNPYWINYKYQSYAYTEDLCKIDYYSKTSVKLAA